jgi:hypothetical protein
MTLLQRFSDWRFKRKIARLKKEWARATTQGARIVTEDRKWPLRTKRTGSKQ